MSVVNHSKLANHISSWIRDYAQKAGIQTLVLGLSGGVDSALVALLCKQTNMPLVCVNMPCHSSSTAFERAAAFAEDYDIRLLKIDLSEAHNSIYSQAGKKGPPFEVSNVNGPEHPIAVGGLRSCLRAPTLSFFANAYRGLIIGTGNRSEDNITRYFQKYGDGCVDISPIADLFKSEVYELFNYLATYKFSPDAVYRESEWREGRPTPATDYRMADSARAIYDAKPTADLWGPDSGQEDEKELGITYDEIEWADREDMRTDYVEHHTEAIGATRHTPGIIFDDADPAKRPDFYRYTGRQQTVLCKLHQMEKISRHKANPNLPVCRVRGMTDLVK